MLVLGVFVEKMVNLSAIEYVHKLLKDGYSVQEIRSHLINSGFAPLEVNSAIDQLSLEKKHFAYKKVLLFFMLGLLFLGVIFLLFFLFSSSTSVAYYGLSSSQNVVSQGGSLVLEHSFVFSGRDGVEISVLEEVFSSGVNVYSLEEKVVLKPSLNTVLNLPSVLVPGDYVVKVSFVFSGKSFFASVPFSIKDESGIKIISQTPVKINIDSCPSVCDDLNDCTRDSCSGGVCVFDPVMFCCGNNVCESSESEKSCPDDCRPVGSVQDYLDKAHSLSSTDANSASRSCSKIANKAVYNDCFFDVSVNSGNALFCSPISDVGYRDACYSKIAMNKKDHNLCNNIVDKSLRDNCNLLISLI